jgi:hypothetical protein
LPVACRKGISRPHLRRETLPRHGDGRVGISASKVFVIMRTPDYARAFAAFLTASWST